MSKYDNIPISEETSKEMRLTSSDRQWLKRAFDLQDQTTEDFIKKTYDEHAQIICGVVRDMIKEQNDAIFAKIDEQNVIIREIQAVIIEIQSELKDHEARIKSLEKKVDRLLKEKIRA